MLGSMRDAMLHEAFYTSGTYHNKSLNLGVGWVAHQGTFSDCMPAWNETDDVCLVFSGEDFRDASEVEGLKARGHRCSSSNAGYLVHLYEELGEDFLGAINGWFSGVLVDLRTDTIVLFNDRYGLQRVYYHEHPRGLVFASEAKALLRALPELREMDLASLGETFALGCVLQNRTLFRRVALLPGASKWKVRRGAGIEKGRYFSGERWVRQPTLDRAQYCERLLEFFQRVLPRYLAVPPRVGMSLTGGLDGRMILAWANAAAGSMPCYSFGGIYRDCADVKIARKLAALMGQSHSTITVGSEFFRAFPDLAEKTVYISDGTMDVSGAVEIHVNRLAREIAPVRLTGNYGSEIIRGNIAFRPGRFPMELLAPDFRALVESAAETYAREQCASRVAFVAFKQVPWYHYARYAVEQSQLTVRSPYLDNELVALVHQAPADLTTSPAPSLGVVQDGDPRLANLATDRGLRYQEIPMISRLMRAYSELTAKAEYAYDYGMPHWLVRVDHALSGLHLERLFLGRHKFYHFRVWYRDRFARYLRDVLLDPRALARGYVEGRVLERALSAHIAGSANYTSEIHRLLTAELIHRRLIESGV